MAREGLGWLAQARGARRHVPRHAGPALYPTWQAGPLLKLAARDPARVTDGSLALSGFRKRGRLLRQALTGRW
jgi:hypothetical protein